MVALPAFPPAIAETVALLTQRCREQHAKLILFGSRAHGKSGLAADWDFGLEASAPIDNRTLNTLKQQCADVGFPYRVDLVDFARAPVWLLEAVGNDYLVLYDPA